jgi:hypothetical protein
MIFWSFLNQNKIFNVIRISFRYPKNKRPLFIPSVSCVIVTPQWLRIQISRIPLRGRSAKALLSS